MTPGPKPRPMAERFWPKVEKTSTCWVWTSSVTPEGYGAIWSRERQGNELAHRVSWRLAGNTLTDGLTLDHLCRNRRCVNPAHLEEVTGRTNILRGEAPSALNGRKTHCASGHPYDEQNTEWRAGRRGLRRSCRICRAASSRASRERRKQGEHRAA